VFVATKPDKATKHLARLVEDWAKEHNIKYTKIYINVRENLKEITLSPTFLRKELDLNKE
jgi:hypothetical protein